MRKSIKIAVAVTAPTAFLLIYLFKEQIFELTKFYGTCTLNMLTGIHCPGCGGTRSVKALLNGDILLAMRNNIVVPFGVLAGLCFYAEIVADIFGKKVKLLPRKPWIWWTVLGAFMIYFIARNFIPQIAPIIS